MFKMTLEIENYFYKCLTLTLTLTLITLKK